MRFCRLTIEKYGALSERTIVLPAEPGFILLYGPNEAGKSTCLAAVCDFLFGVPHNSPHGQSFGYDQIRLSATLMMADGATISLRRRKGRLNRSLSDAEGRLMDEAVLSRYLGGTGRERFATLFGIDHTSLRTGGDRLLATDGDVGRLIVEAGGGLRALVDAMAQIKEEAERHFSTRRSAERLFYKALDAFEVADRDAKAGILTREAFEQALQRHREAMEARDALREQHRESGEQALRLRRLGRVVPVLRRLDATDQELTNFDDVAALPDDFPTRARAAVADLDAAGRALREVEARRAELTAKLNAIEVPATLPGAEAAIRDVVNKAVTVGKARADRANRLQELAGSEAKLNVVRASIGLPADANLDAVMPGRPIIERVQRLANQGLAARAKIESANEQRSIDVAALEHLRQRQDERVSLGVTTPLGVSPSDLQSLPSAQAVLDEKTRQVTQSRGNLAKRLAALGFASLDELAAWRPPEAQVVQAEIDARCALDVEIAKLSDRIATESTRREWADAEIARLTGATGIPSAAVVTAARRARDEAWAIIREIYVSADPNALSVRPQDWRNNDAQAFERHTGEADHIADRALAEAERLATLELLGRQRAEAQVAVETFTAERAGLERRKVSMEEAWLETWRAAVDRFADLGMLKGAVEEWQTICAQAAAIEVVDQQYERLQSDLAPRLCQLAAAEQRLGFVPGASKSLVDRVEATIRAIRAHEAAYADFRRDDAAIRDLALRIAQIEAALRDRQEALAIWRAEWTGVLGPLGLEGEVSPERGNEVATLWATAAGVLDTLSLTRTRLRRMDEDEAQLKRQIDHLAPLLDDPLPTDAVAAAEMLRDRFEAAKKIAIERDSLSAQLPMLTSDKTVKDKMRIAAEDAVEALCREAGCDLAMLLSVAAHCEDRGRMVEQRRNLMDAITAAGDGLPIDELKNQWNDRDLDAIEAELTDVEMETSSLAKQIEDAASKLQDLGRTVAAFSASGGINAAVAARESAATDIQESLRRYVVRILAHDLLSAAMDRVRTEQQDPLVLRASELFAAVTRNAFAAIETDMDGRGEPFVVGRRASGELVHVTRMSDGTRDQLFLAFRIAAIEQYCHAAEPLPFIADDLLVHFDDERSAATLDVLANLGGVTQVLLFTHHRRIVEAAEPLIVQGRAQVLEMACD